MVYHIYFYSVHLTLGVFPYLLNILDSKTSGQVHEQHLHENDEGYEAESSPNRIHQVRVMVQTLVIVREPHPGHAHLQTLEHCSPGPGVSENDVVRQQEMEENDESE